MVKYPLWVHKLLYYTTKHEGGRHIDFRQMYISEADYGQQLQDGFQPTCRRERYRRLELLVTFDTKTARGKIGSKLV